MNRYWQPVGSKNFEKIDNCQSFFMVLVLTLSELPGMFEHLFYSLEVICPLSDALKERMNDILQTKELKKKDFLLRESQVCNHIYFTQKGLLRSFWIKDGKEITSWFMKEGDVIISVNSFYTRQPSYEYIQTIEDSIVHYVHYDELQSLYNNFIEFNIIGRVLTEKYYTLSEERLYSMRKQKAEERFKFLLDKYPEILQRCPGKYIATYLGVSEETFSRIKSKL